MGGLIASGVQTMAWMRNMQCLAMTEIEFSLSPGWGDIRFKAPVRPGDRLRCRGKVTEARRSESNPALGVIHYSYELVDQKDEVKFTALPVALHRVRPDTDGDAS